jgi:histidine triad (HIT) family protein
MPSVFTQIMSGALPGRMVWQDSACVALLTNRPIRPGHALVVPRQEIDHWLDLPPELTEHLFRVSQAVGRGLQEAFRPAKVGVAIVGLEVKHAHIHLVPIDAVGDLDFSKQDMNAQAADLDRAADLLRASLRTLGYAEVTG